MDGVLIDLLNAKWNTFVKSKFYKQFFTFAFYFLITLVCFTLRPGPPPKTTPPTNSTNSTSLNATLLNTTLTMLNHTIAKRESNITIQHKNITIKNSTEEENEVEEWWENLTEECRLMNLDSDQAKVRLIAEVCMLLGAFAYLGAAVREARFLGGRMFFENLVTQFLERRRENATSSFR